MIFDLASVARVLRKLSQSFRRGKLGRELAEEIASHRDMLEQETWEQGSLDCLLFARESFALVLLGLVIGVPVALASVRALKSLLFGVSAMDLSTLIFSILVLAAAALLAITLPLWRATRIQPTIALRYE